MQHHQSDSDSSDDSMNNPPFMKSTMESQRRSSMNQPTDKLSDITHLRDELNRLHKDVSPECNEHIKKMTDLVNDFEKDYNRAFNIAALIAGGVGISSLALGIALAAFTIGASLVASGIGIAAAAAGATVRAIGDFKQKQQEKNIKLAIEIEMQEFQNKISPIINILEKIFNHTQEILRDPMLSIDKANAVRECFTHFEKVHLFQRDSSREVGAHFSRDLSKIFAEMSSVLLILEEIIEDKVKQDDNVNPDGKTARKQIDEKEFKEKADKFIDEMKKGIDHLNNCMNEIDLVKQGLLKKMNII